MTKVILSIFLIAGCLFAAALRADDAARLKRWSAVQATIRNMEPRFASPLDAVFLNDKEHLGKHIVRFGFRIAGYPVFFRNGVAETDEWGNLHRLMMPSLDLGASSPPEAFPSDDQVTQWVRAKGKEAHLPFTRGYFALPDGRLSPAIRVETTPDAKDAEIWFLHSATGRILFSEPLFQTESPLRNLAEATTFSDDSNAIRGAIYLENPHVTPSVTVAPIDFLDEGAVHLYGRYARVETCVDTEKCKQTAPVASKSDIEGNEFVFAPTSDLNAADPFAEVNAYYNLTTQSDWLRDRFGWDALFFGETWITVKVGRYWDNAAYYAGSDAKAPYIVFGRTENFNFAYDSDTARHEFGHAFNDTFWDHPWSTIDAFGFDTTMTAIEESIADLWALSYADDPLLNGYPGFSRNAANTLTCPYNTLGEGHYDARYLDGFLWDLRKIIGKDAFENILYRSLAFLPSPAGYGDLVAGLKESAEALIEEGAPFMEYSHIDAILKTAKERGLLDEDCKARLVPFEDGQTRYAIGYGRPRTSKRDYPFALQWKIRFPKGKTTADIHFTWLYPETNDTGEKVEPGYRVHVRRGSPVKVIRLEDDARKEGEPAFEVEADATFDHSPTDIHFPYDGLSPAAEGEEIYVLLSAASEEPDILMQADLHLTNHNEPLVLPNETDDEEVVPPADETASVGGASCQMSIGGRTRNPLSALGSILF